MEKETKERIAIGTVIVIIILAFLVPLAYTQWNEHIVEVEVEVEKIIYEDVIVYEDRIVYQTVYKDRIVEKIVYEDKFIEVPAPPYEGDWKDAQVQINVNLPFISGKGQVTGFHWEYYLDGELFADIRGNPSSMKASSYYWQFDDNLSVHTYKLIVHAIVDPSSGTATTYIFEKEGTFVPSEAYIDENMQLQGKTIIPPWVITV